MSDSEYAVDQFRAMMQRAINNILQDIHDIPEDSCDPERPDLLHIEDNDLTIILNRHLLGIE